MSRASSVDATSERTPLIPKDEPSRKSSRLPSIVALIALCAAVVAALAFGFATPAIVQEYAKEALVFDAENLSIESFTDTGIRARIKGTITLDATKVKSKPIRDLGRAATWIAHQVRSGDAAVEVYIPQYNNTLLGTADIPPILLNIRNTHVNRINLVVEVAPGHTKGVRELARDFVDGKLTGLNVIAVAKMPVKSGLISLGTQTVTQSLHFDKGDAKIPNVDIGDLNVSELGLPGHAEGILAATQVSAFNPYPVDLVAPPVAMDLLLPDCFGEYLSLGTAKTQPIHILPQQLVFANVTALMRKIPELLTTPCTDSQKSPLDTFVGSYMKGEETKLFVRGGQQDPDKTPKWIGNLLRDTIVPIPVPARKEFDDLIKGFSLSDVHLRLPESAGKPTISAVVKVIVGLPKGIDVNVDVDRVRADADVYYKGQKLGELDLHQWQKANSSKHGEELWIQSIVVDAPLSVTDNDVFAQVIRQMIFGAHGITLGVKAKVDVDSATAVGQFIVRDIPAEGKFSMEPMGGGFKQKIKSVRAVETDEDSMVLKTSVEAMNPTNYSAYIPFANVSLWCNGTKLGDAWGSFDVVPGKNDLVAYASYRKSAVAKEFLSQYLSGQNVTATVRAHKGSLPGLPSTGLDMNVTVPHVFGQFLSETTMHIFSSTATFVLHSPLSMKITTIAASAFYNGTEIGTIAWETPFKVIAGNTETPRFPVDWNNKGGFGLIKDALGGTLKLNARANVGVQIGEFEDTIWYEAKGLGAKIRL